MHTPLWGVEGSQGEKMSEHNADESGQVDQVEAVRRIIDESIHVKRALAAECAEALARAGEILVDCFRGGGKVLLFGNGGSAADAQHIAAEWNGRLSVERPPLPAIALSANTSDLTALGNDYGFDQVFARLMEAHGNEGDVAIAISTSGKSPNVLNAVAQARSCGVRTIGFIGKGGGKLASLVDIPIVVPSDATQRIQECHITMGHILCELVDLVLYPNGSAAEYPFA